MARRDIENIKPFFWSDNWWIEGEEAWFIDGLQNVLFYLNLKTCVCERAISIPDSTFSKFRSIPHCMKYKENVFCMPDAGKSIWIYNVLNHDFAEIKVRNPTGIRLGIHNFWEYKGKIFAVSVGLKQIIEIDSNDMVIDNYYTICTNRITVSTKKDCRIYSLSEVSNSIYEFDMETKKVKEYKLPNIGKKFSHICFDGKDFWLSGYCKEVYVWSQDENIIKVKDKFPPYFGTYDFAKNTDGKVDYEIKEYEFSTFLYIAPTRQSVWFIPFQTNQIVYFDRGTGELLEFKIEEETETKKSLLKRETFEAKYILEYIKDNRYIGLFSLKNDRILEIDVESLVYRWCNFELSDNCVREYVSIRKNLFYESCVFDKEIFARLFCSNKNDRFGPKRNSVGSEIYSSTVSELYKRKLCM